jgi:hypothetical protein
MLSSTYISKKPNQISQRDGMLRYDRLKTALDQGWQNPQKNQGCDLGFKKQNEIKPIKPMFVFVRISVRLSFIMSERLIDATSILHYECCPYTSIHAGHRSKRCPQTLIHLLHKLPPTPQRIPSRIYSRNL